MLIEIRFSFTGFKLSFKTSICKTNNTNETIGGLIIGCIFWFTVDGPITGRAYKRGGGGGWGELISGSLWYMSPELEVLGS